MENPSPRSARPWAGGPHERDRRELLLRGEREHPDARGVGGGLRRPGALLRRRRPAAAEQAAAGAALPAAGAARAAAARAGRCGSTTRTSRSCTTCGTPRCPSPGSDEQLRNLAGRVLGQRLDMAKPLWELWLVEGLADDRWALISKVHHCMVDGVAGTDLMQLMFDLDARRDARRSPRTGRREREPSTAAVIAGAARRGRRRVTHPVAAAAPRSRRSAWAPRRSGVRRTRAGLAADGAVAGQAGDHPDRALAQRPDRPAPAVGVDRRQVRGVQGGPDGARRHGQRRRPHRDHRRLPRPARRAAASCRRRSSSSARWCRCRCGGRPSAASSNNQVSAVFVDLPVGRARPAGPAGVDPRQMDEYKRPMQAVDARSIIAMGDFVAPTLLSLGVRAALQAGADWCQAVTTNVPGPPGAALRARQADDSAPRVRADRRRHPLLDRRSSPT